MGIYRDCTTTTTMTYSMTAANPVVDKVAGSTEVNYSIV